MSRRASIGLFGAALLISAAESRAGNPPRPSGFLDIFQTVRRDMPGEAFNQTWDIRFYVPQAEEASGRGALRDVFAAPSSENRGPGDLLGAGAWEIQQHPFLSGNFSPSASDPHPGVMSVAGLDMAAPVAAGAEGAAQPPIAGEDKPAANAAIADDDLPVIPLVGASLVGLVGVAWLGILIKKPQLLKEAARGQPPPPPGLNASRGRDPDRLDVREFL